MNNELKKLDKRSDAEITLFKGRETNDNQRQLQLKVIEQERQKVKQ